MISDSINLHCVEGITYRVEHHPFLYTIRSILSGVLELDVVDTLNDNTKNRIIRDLSDITQGVLPMWMPYKYTLPEKRQKYLVKRLKDYIK
jgi:hypothetical protein